MVYEVLRAGRRRPSAGLARGLRIVATFTVLAVLWSMWTADSLGQWLGLWSVAPGLGLALAVLVPALHAAARALDSRTRDRARPLAAAGGKDPSAPCFWRSSGLIAAGIVTLLALGTPSVAARFGEGAEIVAESLSGSRLDGFRLNERDARALERGYYEHLFALPRRNPELHRLYAGQPADWLRIDQTTAWRERDDLLIGELVPGARIRFKGAELSVNRWGQRDRDTRGRSRREPSVWRSSARPTPWARELPTARPSKPSTRRASTPAMARRRSR